MSSKAGTPVRDKAAYWKAANAPSHISAAASLRTALVRAFIGVCALSTSASAHQTDGRTILHDYDYYTKNSYIAFAGPWGAGNLVEGVDYLDTIKLWPESFSERTLIKWRWPEVPAQSVYGFMQVSFGDYDGGNPQNPVPSKTVNDIIRLTASHSFRLSGEMENFTAIYDFFLTDVPQGTNLKEIEVFLHTPPKAEYFVTHSTQIGSYSDKSGTWTVALANNDILFMPADEADIPEGEIDFKSMLNFLTSNNIISGSEYFNGVALGTEPFQGVGSINVRYFHVDYQ
jgi:hypothetical protein